MNDIKTFKCVKCKATINFTLIANENDTRICPECGSLDCLLSPMMYAEFETTMKNTQTMGLVFKQLNEIFKVK
jgi:NAD-dependent SIR2 family protein deacetylase